jgi:hypothetical protein
MGDGPVEPREGEQASHGAAGRGDDGECVLVVLDGPSVTMGESIEDRTVDELGVCEVNDAARASVEHRVELVAQARPSGQVVFSAY